MKALQGIDSIREKVRERDNYTCQKCGKKWQIGMRRLDVHHLDLQMESKRVYSYDVQNQDKMITYCHKCHLNEPHIKEKMKIRGKKDITYDVLLNGLLKRSLWIIKNNVFLTEDQGDTIKTSYWSKQENRERMRIIRERQWAGKKGIVYDY